MNIETTNATTDPISNKSISLEAIAPADKMYFIPFNKDAPNITGIDKKNENSQATSLLHKSSIAPNIVTPLLEVPGIKASN